MNDLEEAQATVPAAPPATSSAGALLRAAREAQGLHIAALAVALKVPVKKIEALEADRFQDLLDVVFARSLAMSVCRTLKIDPEPVLSLLPALTENKLKPMDGGLNTHFRDVTLAAQSTWRNQLLSPIGLGAIALLLATVVVLVWRTPSDSEAGTSTPAAAPVLSGTVTEPTMAVAPPSLTVEPATTATNATDGVQNSGTPTNSVGDTAAPGGPGVLLIKARGVSWIEVNDADGVPRLRKLSAAGEELQVAGKLPLSVVLGRADQLDVLVRDQPVDLTSSVRDNVARFEVK